ncbi:MAG: GTP-binding protein [Eubacteriales bacterium]|jgi:bifunctional enzyme CysN/CysC|nr:GTP-binding protein [Clostridiales bacterium]
MNIVIVGHVDHGKSTVIGRLLADTDSLPKGKLEQIRELCRRNSKPFEYAFLLDALKDERSQGITIDTARCFFHTAKRKYIIIDAPGHVEFLKNMVSGAARAEAALLVIDAAEGVRENSRRHGYMLSMLGIRQIAVLVNKMDLVGWSQEVYENIKREYGQFLSEININPSAFIPVSAREGDNIASRSQNMPWYSGMTVLDELDSFTEQSVGEDLPFRMPVQDVYRFTAWGDNRRIIAGTVESGSISAGDEVIFYPSGKRTNVASIEVWNAPSKTKAKCGEPTGFTVGEQIYVRRGELAAKVGEPAPHVSTRFSANIFWLGKNPLTTGKRYIIKIGTAKVDAEIERIVSVLDSSTLEKHQGSAVNRNDIAEVIINCVKQVAFDISSDMEATGRFVVVDDYEISGGGIITAALTDDNMYTRELVLRRNMRWDQSEILPMARAERYGQKPAIVIITGARATAKKTIARKLERKLFEAGRSAYFLGMGNLLYGVAAEIKTPGIVPERGEHIRRLGEVANIMLDAGLILIVTAAELTASDIDIITMTSSPENLLTVWLGSEITTDIPCNLQIPAEEVTDEYIEAATETIKDKMHSSGIIF